MCSDAVGGTPAHPAVRKAFTYSVTRWIGFALAAAVAVLYLLHQRILASEANYIRADW